MIDAQLRRAVSTAYYAVFHAIMRRAAERFMGAGHARAAGYRLIYRSFDHGRVGQICLELASASLSAAMKRDLARPFISSAMREFARSFPEIQGRRHAADYDPTIMFDRASVQGLIDTAEAAIAAFDAADPAEQADILALMMTRRRA